MCGITGVFAFTDFGRQAFAKLEKAIKGLSHRGPDAEGAVVCGRVALAHRRLSVIAPTVAANQPMSDTSGRYTIIFNGEIFNYRQLRCELQQKGISFATDSDTEVILQLYRVHGQEAIKKLRGFFVFAIYDTAEESLFIARDRFGEKPLLYYKDADKFLFASELRALLTLGVPRELDPASLYQYLQLTYVPAPASMIKNVKKLLPGHSLYIKGSRVQEMVWYRLPFDAPKAAQNPLTYKQQQLKLAQLMEKAVEDRLTADVPVGAFLSGGLDSSVVVALASKTVSQLKTFSLGFKDNSFFDETAYARIIADKYKTDHTEVLYSTQDLFEDLPGMLASLSEPFADSSALAVYALSKHARTKVKAVLSGDGADELFAGYNKHRAEYKVLNGGFAAGTVAKLQKLWEVLPKSRNSFAANKIRQLHRFAEGAHLSKQDRYWLWATWQQEEEAYKLLHAGLQAEAKSRMYRARKKRLTEYVHSNNLYSINNVLWSDWHLVLGNDMLPKIDMMGMAHGLEVRSPFLDHRVVKFAFSLPAASKIDAVMQKKLLNDTFKNILPTELSKRTKKGFEIPLLPLLKIKASNLIRYYLSDEFLIAQGVFSVEEIRKVLKIMSTSAAGTVQTKVWTLLVFQYWWEQWMQDGTS